MRQRALDAGVFVIFPILLLGLASRAADDGSAVVENQDVARVAPVCQAESAPSRARARVLIARIWHANPPGRRTSRSAGDARPGLAPMREAAPMLVSLSRLGPAPRR